MLTWYLLDLRPSWPSSSSSSSKPVQQHSSLRCTTSTLSRSFPSLFEPRVWDCTVLFKVLQAQSNNTASQWALRRLGTSSGLCISYITPSNLASLTSAFQRLLHYLLRKLTLFSRHLVSNRSRCLLISRRLGKSMTGWRPKLRCTELLSYDGWLLFTETSHFLKRKLQDRRSWQRGFGSWEVIWSRIQFILSLPHWCHFSSLTHKNVMSRKNSRRVHFLIIQSLLFQLYFTQGLGGGHVYCPGCLLPVREYENLSVGDHTPPSMYLIVSCIQTTAMLQEKVWGDGLPVSRSAAQMCQERHDEVRYSQHVRALLLGESGSRSWS